MALEDIINGFIGKGEKVEIVAPRQSGETHFALQMGFAVSQGLPFCGRATKEQGVLYVDLHGELGEVLFTHIEKVFCKNYGIDKLDNIVRLPIDCHKVKDITELVDKIEPYTWDGYSFVIIDPIGKIVDIDSFNEWVHHVTFEFNRKLICDRKSTVVCVHNTIKNWTAGGCFCLRRLKNAEGHEIQEQCFDTNISMADLDIPEGTLFQNGLPLNTQGFQINSISRYHADHEFSVIFEDEFFRADTNGILGNCDFVKKTKHKKSSWID